ncbi:MAG: hypothetical protein KDA61_14595 [Planctomycetales bacterium]|nr:hypothetical protein [Planctomycetales bacterium]
MLRSLFLALGVFSCLLGLEALAVETAVLKRPQRVNGQTVVQHREVTPPDWAPWSLMAGGAVVVLYSFTIPRRYA